ncbi:MAG: crossover junction endodeoxyribonuclease RuvC [Bacteroidota bacterium]
MNPETAKQIEGKIILGIDPGTTIMGYGVISVKGQKMELLVHGVLHLAKLPDQALKLEKIYSRVTELCKTWLPDEMAIEAPFFGKNVQSMLKLGRAQGVAIAAAIAHAIPVMEYEPRKIKQSVTGNGNASKEQVSAMIVTLLKMDAAPELLDASDALAAAICHHFQNGNVGKKSKSWSSFVKDNAGRVVGGG